MVVASPARTFDVGVLGATGFTGKLACEYLSKNYASGLTWAVAGRSESKLASLRAALGIDEAHVRIVDCYASESVEALAKECRVIANFAGTPFADKALPVVEACARHGTHYIDITGEVHLHRASYDAHHEQAMASKALIVHSCGYDSIPSDLGAYLAATKLREVFGVPCAELKTFAGSSKGGISGGTLATALGAITGRIKHLPGVSEAAARGVYALDPAGDSGGPDTSDFGGVRYDRRVDTWHSPNVMAGVNAPVVRKSAALLAYAARPGGCRYSEVSAAPSRFGAFRSTALLALAGAGLAVPPVRGLLFRLKVLPLPGEGPSQETRENGYFHTWVLGIGESGSGAAEARDGDSPEAERPPMVIADVRSGTAGDPGYKATAQMAIESALCLALQRDECEAAGGVLTPAAAMGSPLVERLNRSGMELGARVLGEAE